MVYSYSVPFIIRRCCHRHWGSRVPRTEEEKMDGSSGSRPDQEEERPEVTGPARHGQSGPAIDLDGFLCPVSPVQATLRISSEHRMC